VTTALIGAVLIPTESSLATAFGIACVCATIHCVGASVPGLLLIERDPAH
jgi:hypothetical protein